MTGTDAIRKLTKISPQHCLITIYKSFVRLYLDYSEVL